MGQTAQKTGKRKTAEPTTAETSMPLAATPPNLLLRSLPKGQDEQATVLSGEPFLDVSFSLLCCIRFWRFASKPRMKVATALSNPSMIDPRGHTQLQNTLPNTRTGSKKRSKATRVKKRYSMSMKPVAKTCSPPTGQISHAPGPIWP
jgi:hypothetical protein